jgi:RIO-like serine/threonine protein kinase
MNSILWPNRGSSSDDGYKLTYLGYDFLALKAFCSRNTVSLIGPKIGVGKESGALGSLIARKERI